MIAYAGISLYHIFWGMANPMFRQTDILFKQTKNTGTDCVSLAGSYCSTVMSRIIELMC